MEIESIHETADYENDRKTSGHKGLRETQPLPNSAQVGSSRPETRTKQLPVADCETGTDRETGTGPVIRVEASCVPFSLPQPNPQTDSAWTFPLETRGKVCDADRVWHSEAGQVIDLPSPSVLKGKAQRAMVR